MLKLFSVCRPRYGYRPKLAGSLRLLSVKDGGKTPEEGSQKREIVSPNRLGDSYVQYWKEKRSNNSRVSSFQNGIDGKRDFSSDKRLTFSIEMISDLTRLLGSRSSIDRRLKDMMNERLLVFAGSSQSFENHQYTINLLQTLARKDFTAFYDRGVKEFINSALKHTLQHQEQDMRAIMELLVACARLSYHIQLPGAVNEAMMKELVCKISNEYVAKDFSSYSEYFYVLGKMLVPWRILPIEKRKGLMSCLKRFGEVEDGEVGRARGRLIYAVEKLLILKQSIEDTDQGMRQHYERLLMRELEGRYSERGSREMRGEDERMPVR